MESPSSWGRAERVVHEVRLEYERGRAEFRCGLSFEMLICNALRREGLLCTEDTSKSGDGSS